MKANIAKGNVLMRNYLITVKLLQCSVLFIVENITGFEIQITREVLRRNHQEEPGLL